MAITTQRHATAIEPAGEPPSDRGRAILRRGTLPNGRAIAGGLLVTLAVLGLFVSYRSASEVSTVDYLIARHEIRAGRVITAADLALAPMTLYASTAGNAFTRPDDVIGKIAVVTVRDGALVQHDDLAERALPDRGRRVSIELEPSQALNGRLDSGDRVDIVSAPTGGDPAAVIERDALVAEVDGRDDSGGTEVGAGGARLTVTLVVPDEDAARRLVDARAHGTVTLVGSSAVTLEAAVPTTVPATEVPTSEPEGS